MAGRKRARETGPGSPGIRSASGADRGRSAPGRGNAPSGSRAGSLGRFVGIFAGCVVPFYVLMGTPLFLDRIFPSYLAFTAGISGWLIDLLEADVRTIGAVVSSARFSIEIKYGCDGLEPAVLFSAATLAFPVRWTPRLMGVVLGCLFLFVLNLIRIVSLYLVGAYSPDLFHLAHVEVWQTLFILLAIATWIFWVRWAVRRERRTA